MSEPTFRREGNLRFASVSHRGWVDDPEPLLGRVRAHLDEVGGERYGAPFAFVALPGEEDLDEWEVQVGYACLGLIRPKPPVLIEDFRALNSLGEPHHGPVRELGLSRDRLADHARSMSWQVRPYWRVTWHRDETPDGFPHPWAEVSVFVDR